MSTNKTTEGKSNGQSYRDGETLRELYHDEEMTIPEIADEFGVADSTIFRWIERNGIETRKRGTGKASYVPFDIDGHGYERWKDKDLGNDTTVRVHQLLAISCGASPYHLFGGDNHIHHQNEIPWDNRPENIEVVTPSEHGHRHFVGSDNPMSKLTECDVRDIRHRADDGESYESIAESYPVLADSIQRIHRGNVWTHVE
jgi:hypothetical protein